MILAHKLSNAFASATRSSCASTVWMWSRSSHTATVAKRPNSASRKILASSADSEYAALSSGSQTLTNSVCLTSAFLNGSLDLQNLEYALPSLKSPGRRCPPPSITVPVAVTLIVPQKAEIMEPAGERAVTIEEPALPAASTPVRCTNRLIRIRKRKMKVHHRKKRMKKHMASFKRMWLKRQANTEVAFRVEMMGKVKLAQKFDATKYVDESLDEFRRVLVPCTIDGKRRPQWLIKQIIEERDVKRERENRMKTDLITQEPLVREGESVEDFVKRMDAPRRK